MKVADARALQGKEPIERVPDIIQRLYALVGELETHFPGRPFTPDGHLVGSIGEVLAAHRYGLELLPCSSECHDARAEDGRLVQIKATQRRSVGLRGEPEHLIVLQILPNGTSEEIYNGPGAPVWKEVRPLASNGQYTISSSKLRKLMAVVPPDARLPTLRA